jgi:hypothetical protein
LSLLGLLGLPRLLGLLGRGLLPELTRLRQHSLAARTGKPHPPTVRQRDAHPDVSVLGH